MKGKAAVSRTCHRVNQFFHKLCNNSNNSKAQKGYTDLSAFCCFWRDKSGARLWNGSSNEGSKPVVGRISGGLLTREGRRQDFKYVKGGLSFRNIQQACGGGG